MDGAFRLSTGDAVAWLSGLPAASAQLVILDPGVPGRAPRRPGRAQPAIPAFAEQALPALLYEVHRVLARGGLCWWVTETSYAFRASRLADRLGFSIGAPLVWDRGDGPGARLAFVLPLSDGRPRSPGPELVQASRPERPDGLPTLPQLLCDALIDAASAPGDVIVDPCMGEGATGISALQLGRAYLGNDLAPFEPVVRDRLAKIAPSDGAACERLAAILNGPRAHEVHDAMGPAAGADARRPSGAKPHAGIEEAGQLTIF